jgi:hypothetical protein
MPKYFFDIKNGHRLIDPSGLDCRDDQQAMRSATFIARQIAVTRNRTGLDIFRFWMPPDRKSVGYRWATTAREISVAVKWATTPGRAR